MEENLISEAISLTIFGMGFVFVFLILLVFVTKLMSYLLNKNNNTLDSLNKQSPENSLITDSDIDEETRFVIERAIKIHTGA